MILPSVWAFVVCYFLLLWYATSLEMAVAGSIIFVFFALKLTVTALGLLASARPDPADPPELPGVANRNHPPRGSSQR